MTSEKNAQFEHSLSSDPFFLAASFELAGNDAVIFDTLPLGEYNKRTSGVDGPYRYREDTTQLRFQL